VRSAERLAAGVGSAQRRQGLCPAASVPAYLLTALSVRVFGPARGVLVVDEPATTEQNAQPTLAPTLEMLDPHTLDQAATDKDALVADFTAQVTALEERLRNQDEELQQARADLQRATQEAADAARDLVSARTHIATLQGAYDGLLERITPPPAQTGGDTTT